MLALKTGARYRTSLLCRTSAGAPYLIKIQPREERPGTYVLKQFHPNNPRPNNGNKRRKAIDLFSLNVLFSQYRSCDNTPRELFLSNFFLFTCISTHNLLKDNESSALGTSCGKKKTYKLKRFLGDKQIE